LRHPGAVFFGISRTFVLYQYIRTFSLFLHISKNNWHSKMADNPNLLNYDDDSIKTLDWREHIRLRPGMYIGKLGDGSSMDDGIYILLKEVADNSIDEFRMGAGKQIDILVEDGTVKIRDY